MRGMGLARARAPHLEQRDGERDGGRHAQLRRNDLAAVGRIVLGQRVACRTVPRP